MNTNELPWQVLRENVSRKFLARDEAKNFQADIIKLEPNLTYHEHLHPDVEWVYVLKGGFKDERGEYKVGSFVENPKGSKHTVTVGAEGCEILCFWCGEVLPTI